jgi:quinohemoprotein ethanol dehydrogenase
MVGSGGGGQISAPAFTIPLPVPIDLTTITSTGDAKRGFVLFNQNCQVCHGANATGASLPDLNRTPMLTSAAGWNAIVIQGDKAPHGMASFARFLTPRDAKDIRA